MQAIFKTWKRKRKGQEIQPVMEDENAWILQQAQADHGPPLVRNLTARPRGDCVVCSCSVSCCGSGSGNPIQPSAAGTQA